MLEVSKSISLTANSIIAEKSVVYMSAQVSTDGKTTYSSDTIQDQALYESNKSTCRADMEEFKKKVFEIEDKISVEITREVANENQE